MIRILHVTTAYYPEMQFGGPPAKIHALSRGLLKRGHEVRVVTLHSKEPGRRHTVAYDDVNVQYLPWVGRGVWQLPLGWRTLRAAISWADVVHCYGFYNFLGPQAAFWARHLKRQYVVEPMGMYLPIVRSLIKKRLYHQTLGRWFARQAARVIATSTQEQAELIGAGLDPHRVVIRRNGIDLADFQQLPKGGCFRQQYGIAADERLILYLGRLSPKKGLPVLLEAFSRVSLPKVRLAIVGPDDGSGYEHEIRQQVNTLRIAQRVVFPGPLYGESKLEALADADVFVLPSLNENFGNAVAEAVAADLPVIISAQCGIAPFIRDRVGLVIDVQPDTLANAFEQLLIDEALRESFRANCPVVARELSWEEPLQKMEQIYQEIALRH